MRRSVTVARSARPSTGSPTSPPGLQSQRYSREGERKIEVGQIIMKEAPLLTLDDFKLDRFLISHYATMTEENKFNIELNPKI